ncbi:hypothetical protein BGX27_009677 [Mortierella sp. AM989]|nr:hypothetical protein BGX27_009677 [Mortierella sp. AM989]
MQALMVIDKAKEHDYMREISKDHSLATIQARRHLQDLHLVEYCCRLVCAHEDRLENINIVKTLEHLNSAVLKPARAFQTRSRVEYKTTFQLNQDPLLDYTLAILTRSWSQLSSDFDSKLLPQGLSVEQAAFASAASPLLRAVIHRRLFPSATFIIQDSASVHGSAPNSRKSVLQMFLSNGDQMSSMQWIWLWDRRDRKDWLGQWDQLEFRQWLAVQLLQSGRPDWTIDLFRLTSKAGGAPNRWIQDLITTTSSIMQPDSTKKSQSLEWILRLSDMDASAFGRKRLYYNLDSWMNSDHVRSWVLGLQDPDLMIHHSNHIVEQHLWRDMAMIGAFSRNMSRKDIVNSLSSMVVATICPSDLSLSSQFIGGSSGVSSSSVNYRDALIDYLDELAINCLNAPTPLDKSPSKLYLNQKSSEAIILLKRAIQEIMSKYNAEDRSSYAALDTYRNFLHDVTHHTAFRSGNMSLVSQVAEARFHALYGGDVWDKATSAIKSDAGLSSQLEGQPLREHKVLVIPEIRDFIMNHMQPTIAKMSASRILSRGSPMTMWGGRLSDWFMAVANASPITGPMASGLQHTSYLKPGTQAYDQTLKTLLEYQEFDLAANLHSYAYELTDAKKLLKAGVQMPSVKELGTLIHQLATSDKDPHHLRRAQWILDQHLVRERNLAEIDSSYGKPRLIDIQIVTELVGAWSRRAQFAKARNMVEIMWNQEIRPNMIFYNTMLKALMDLTAYSRASGRSMGSGKQTEMRELGRGIMVRQLLKSRGLGDSGKASKDDIAKLVRSELDHGWDLFQDVISAASDVQAKSIHLPAYGADSPSMLRSLIARTIRWFYGNQSGGAELEVGRFKPDAYTFSILLGAYAQRADIESISELFVEMKNLHLEPDAVICSILANAFAKKGDLRALDRVIYEARTRYIDPGLYLANVVLDSLVEKGVSASKIRETLDSMIAGNHGSETQYVDPDGETEIPVRRIGGNHNHLREGHQNHAGPSNHSLMGKSLEPSSKLGNGLDAVTLTTLIKYHARQNDIGAALDLVQLMVQAGLVPNNRVYVLLLAASIRKQDIVAGLNTMQSMRVYSKIFPDAKAWKGLLRCAMELEKQQPLIIRQQRPSELSNRLPTPRNSANEAIHQQQREQPVFSVLKELSRVLDEIEADAVAKGKEARSTSRDYLLEIMTTSWLSLSDNKQEDKAGSLKSHDDNRSTILNSDIKGQNGLLRRLLNHMLRVQDGSRKKSGRFSKQEQQQQQYQGKDLESAEGIDQRCKHAIWLVRLVESHGIELGQRWKWDVVIPRVQSLTRRNPRLIMKQLGGAKHYSWKRKRKDDTL